MKNWILVLTVTLLTYSACHDKPKTAQSFAALTLAKDSITYSPTGDTLLHVPTTVKICDTVITCHDSTSWATVVKPLVYIRKNLLFDFTTENADAFTLFNIKLLHNYCSVGSCCSYSITRSSDFARSGKYSSKYDLRIADADVASSKRTEAARASNDEPTIAERWYGASYRLDSANYKIDLAPELLTQWQSRKGISPPLAIWTENGRWIINQHMNKSSDVTGQNDITETKTDIGPYKVNKWTDFVAHIKWSQASDGLIEIWKDGVKVFTKAGPNTYYGISTGNYLKNGIYKWPWAHPEKYKSSTTRRVVYIDDVRIGNEKATYKDVAPGN